jgi:hypothetical protein
MEGSAVLVAEVKFPCTGLIWELVLFVDRSNIQESGGENATTENVKNRICFGLLLDIYQWLLELKQTRSN